MESSRRYLLQAEIEYWHEMLRINKSRLSRYREDEMRNCLKQALRAMNSATSSEFRAAA
jgi:plasmid stability protein